MDKTFGQKISMTFAVLCYIAGLGCAIGAYMYPVKGEYDAIQASLMASIVFFVGCGIVLHAIATTRLRGIVTLSKPDTEE
ncbi:MAG: hemerythrin family protein [Gammaproteobacteria bacterium]|nr:hemerythrin family protein [Gammaproteobacteria bacterium]MBU1646388.1 hemerythrin family protein [Gammaproteobacteria bacterium]MBU1970931.1 hemerythrin family protein [Gammaproteobacteria bacterium]